MGHSGACTAWARAGQTKEGPGGGGAAAASHSVSYSATVTPSSDNTPNE